MKKKICEEYKCKINNILKGKQDENASINEAWDQLKQIVSGASVEVLGRTKWYPNPSLTKYTRKQLREENKQDRNS